ncbi:MCE family protein [Actinomadura alba]|uniref:MCE family protein n=2 Tax=Actinomadura alba TaxID=406431 RepID=A0ABR7LI63_9ACTN|nr:MCE family protein [Actinomadura alba]
MAMIAAAVALAILPACSFHGAESLPLPGGPDLGEEPYEVEIDFANVLDLVPQSVVKVNDVSVGKITDIRLDGWHARVTCKIRKDVVLPDNAIASVAQTSLLGEKYVELSPPSGEAAQGRLGAGDVIPLARTSRGTEIEEVLSALSLLLNGGGLEQISTITNELNAAMQGRTDTIKDVLQRVNTFVGTLDRHRGAITQALDSLDRLSGKLAAQRRTIADTVDRTGPAIKVLDQNRADLTKMLVSLDKLSKVTTRVVNQSKADLLANLRALQPILQNLNKAGNDLPNSLEMMLTFPFPPSVANALRGDYANIHITLDLDLKSLTHNLLGGTALEGLTEQGDQVRSMIRPPSLTLPQTPPGVLEPSPGAPGVPGLPGVPGVPAPGGSSTPTPRPSSTADPGLFDLIMGGLS